MTDRVDALTVVLDKDYRTDDVEAITNAIGMVKGVASVTPKVVGLSDHAARERVRSELRMQILKILCPWMEEKG